MEMVEEEAKISHKQIKPEVILENEDRISMLPDCLIIEILSRLPFIEYAIRTSTLSKRWINIWTSLPTLVFKMYSCSYFFSLVDKILTQCRPITLNKFSVDPIYEIQFESKVRNWIHFAINHNVKHLELRLRNTWFSTWKAEFELDQSIYINSCFTHLKLEGFIFNPTRAISWKSLNCLSIFYAKIDENVIGNTFSGCPVLETLMFYKCYGYRRVDITSKSVKNFVLWGYNDPEAKVCYFADVIEINAPNILSLTIQYEFLLSKILLLDVSSLVKAKLDYDNFGHFETKPKQAKQEMFKEFILKLRHVKDLKIGILCFGAFLRLEATGFIFPSNLKYLNSLEIADAVDWFDSDGG